MYLFLNKNKYLAPYIVISEQEDKIYRLEQIIAGQNEEIIMNLLKIELSKIEAGTDIELKKTKESLENNLTLEKFNLLSGFYYGIYNTYPGSGFIDFYEEKIVVLSSRGVLAFNEDISDESESFKQIRTNLKEFIGLEQFKKRSWFSLKDLLIFNEKIFISFTEEIENDCWNTSIVFADMDYKNIKFTKLFSSQKCVHPINNIDKEFNAHQSGGRIISFDNDHILFSTGDYRNRHLAQDKQSLNGKVLKINISTGNYEIISMGHRNPQGLFFDKDKNIILETEHGPQGGDEINIIEVSKINQDELQNYGWAISSAGEHYGGRNEGNKTTYEKYPLFKSHSEYGYIEPIKSFVPSIGISEIVKIGNNKYVVSSLRDKSIYFFELDGQNKITNFERVEVSERIRDLKFKDNQLYLFMEDSASIGIIKLRVSELQANNP